MACKKKPRRKTELDLVEEARSLNPTAAMAELIEKYGEEITVFVRTVARIYRLKEEYSELRQRGIEGMLLAINRFDKRRKNFFAFAKVYIKGRMLSRSGAREIPLDLALSDESYAEAYIKGRELCRQPCNEFLAIGSSNDDGGEGDVNTPGVVPWVSGRSAVSLPTELKEMWQLTTQLPRNQRVVLYLRYKEGLNFRETGERMGIKKQAVEQVEKNAIKNLKVLVKNAA